MNQNSVFFMHMLNACLSCAQFKIPASNTVAEVAETRTLLQRMTDGRKYVRTWEKLYAPRYIVAGGGHKKLPNNRLLTNVLQLINLTTLCLHFAISSLV